MLYEFLKKNKDKILLMTEAKSRELAGTRESSKQLERGLPLFYQQFLDLLSRQNIENPIYKDQPEMAAAAQNNDEQAMAKASGHPDEIPFVKTAGLHGAELLRLGYTLSHVVHAYGAMCQSITELAIEDKTLITAQEFHDLNRCLDAAIAGAVTEFQSGQNAFEENREVEHLGFLAHELRNALSTSMLSFQMIKGGTVGFQGSTGKVLERGLKRIGDLIDRSLTEVRLRVDPKIYSQAKLLLQTIDQILLTAQVEARTRGQHFVVDIDSELVVNADQQLFYAAVSNLIQNAMKYSHSGGKITIRAKYREENIEIEIEDECGGLRDESVNLFKAFEQKNENRKGLGLGLTIAQRAITLNGGTLKVLNLPEHGCVFKIVLPKVFVGKN